MGLNSMMFMIEVIVKGVVSLDYIILRGVPNFFVFPIYIHEVGRILETPLKIRQSIYD